MATKGDILLVFLVLFLIALPTVGTNSSTAKQPIPYRIGYITKDNPSNAQAIAAWLGRPLDVMGTTVTITGWWVTFPSTSVVSAAIPMLSMPGWDTLGAHDMAQAASGAYDTHYKNMATSLANSKAHIDSVRFGWEMNGNWYPWSAGGPGGNNTSHANYIATFRRMANIFRETLPGVKIEFCTNWSYKSQFSVESGTPVDYWPGSQYVDVISMDFYQSDIGGNWTNTQSGGTYNLDWLVSFARSKGVKVGLSEWGAANDDGSYITSAAHWMNSLGDLFVYQVYSQYAPADQVVVAGSMPKEQAAWIQAWRDTYYSR